MVRRDFKTLLAEGQIGEGIIAQWLRSRGWNVLPVYEKVVDDKKGPRVWSVDFGQLIAPDMLVFKAHNTIWIEAKNKSAFSLHRKTGDWTTGIDINCYNDYLRISEISLWPVWLLFLQNGGIAKGDHEFSPSGLYGGDIDDLRDKEHHRWEKYGKGGMVYWAHDTLTHLCALEELERLEAISAAPTGEREERR